MALLVVIINFLLNIFAVISKRFTCQMFLCYERKDIIARNVLASLRDCTGLLPIIHVFLGGGGSFGGDIY